MWTVDAGGADPFEHRMFPQVRPGHDVAHLGQRDRDGAHPGAADADHVQPVGHTQVDRRRLDRPRLDRHGLDRHGVDRYGWEGRHDDVDVTATRSIKLARAPGRCTSPRRAAAADERGARVGIGAEPFDLATEAFEILVAEHHGSTDLGEPLDVVALVVVGRPGQGTRTAGMPVDRHLVHGARSATADEQVGRRVHRSHVGS